jgi:hypothetical protein
MPPTDAAVAELGGLPEPTRYQPGEWARSISAAPARLPEMLEAMAAEVGADELIVQDLIAEPADRRLLRAHRRRLRPHARPPSPVVDSAVDDEPP